MFDRTLSVPLTEVAVSQCVMWLDQTVRNLICGDLEIALVVIRLGRGEERWCDLVCVKRL